MFKRKKNENGEEMENFFDVFIRNYKNLPGFKDLVKLVLYLGLIGIFMLVILLNQGTTQTENTTTTTTTEAVSSSLTYKEILENLYLTDKTIHINITQNGEQILIDAENNSNILTGFIENTTETSRFKIENNVIYELNLSTETENAELFSGLNLDYIIPANLVNILENTKATKSLNGENINYNYTFDDNITTAVVIVNSSEVISITLNTADTSYVITYE